MSIRRENASGYVKAVLERTRGDLMVAIRQWGCRTGRTSQMIGQRKAGTEARPLRPLFTAHRLMAENSSPAGSAGNSSSCNFISIASIVPSGPVARYTLSANDRITLYPIPSVPAVE